MNLFSETKKLHAKNLKKIYKKKEVVSDVSISVERGRVIGLLGPNGAGKTTSFYMIVGIIKQNHGNIYMDDIDISSYPMYERGKLGITYLPQEKSIFRNLSVLENILAILEYKIKDKKKRLEKAYKIMESLNITHIRDGMGYRLSGGETRRVEIARALAADPYFILLDEPFTGIDPKSIEDLQSIILDLKKQGIGILITDHNVRETLKITDFSYIIYEGKILTSGKADDLIKDPVVKSSYLGNTFDL